jgi:hypothetical protein
MSDKIKENEAGGASVANAFEKALISESGDELTSVDLEALQELTKTDLEAYFKELP